MAFGFGRLFGRNPPAPPGGQGPAQPQPGGGGFFRGRFDIHGPLRRWTGTDDGAGGGGGGGTAPGTGTTGASVRPKAKFNAILCLFTDANHFTTLPMNENVVNLLGLSGGYTGVRYDLDRNTIPLGCVTNIELRAGTDSVSSLFANVSFLNRVPRNIQYEMPEYLEFPNGEIRRNPHWYRNSQIADFYTLNEVMDNLNRGAWILAVGVHPAKEYKEGDRITIKWCRVNMHGGPHGHDWNPRVIEVRRDTGSLTGEVQER